MTCKVERNFIIVFDRDLLRSHGLSDRIDWMVCLAIKSGHDSICLVMEKQILTCQCQLTLLDQAQIRFWFAWLCGSYQYTSLYWIRCLHSLFLYSVPLDTKNYVLGWAEQRNKNLINKTHLFAWIFHLDTECVQVPAWDNIVNIE